MVNLDLLAQAIISGKAPDAKAIAQQALDEGISASDILNNGLVAGMNVVGAKFKNNEFYVPEVLIAARAMKMAMEVIKPALSAGGVEPKGKVAIGTVKGDLHDIGKNLVSMMMEGAGFQIFDRSFRIIGSGFWTVGCSNCDINGCLCNPAWKTWG